jgi:hypothetical protein
VALRRRHLGVTLVIARLGWALRASDLIARINNNSCGNQIVAHGIATIGSSVAPTSGTGGLGGEIGAVLFGEEHSVSSTAPIPGSLKAHQKIRAAEVAHFKVKPAPRIAVTIRWHSPPVGSVAYLPGRAVRAPVRARAPRAGHPRAALTFVCCGFATM